MSRTPGAKDKKPRNYTYHRDGITAPVETPAGYNTDSIDFLMSILPSEPLDYDDVEEMESRFNHYLEMCKTHDKKVMNRTAYMAIGIDYGMIREWLNNPKLNPRRFQFVKKVTMICSAYREGLMADGKVNPVTGIFWQKNYDGMKDQSEVILTPNTDPLGDKKDAEQLKDKYLGMQTQNKLPDKSQNG